MFLSEKIEKITTTPSCTLAGFDLTAQNFTGEGDTITHTTLPGQISTNIFFLLLNAYLYRYVQK
jgi:hypothetical protein